MAGNIEAPLFNPSDVAARCFPREGVIQVNHNGNPDNYQPLKPFLEANDANPAEISRVFSEEGEWILRSEHDQSIYEKSPDVVDRYLRIFDRPLTQNLIDLSLNAAHENGFNNHGEDHAARVVTVMRALSRARGEGDYEQRQDVIFGRKHDLFCVASRDHHPEGGVLMMDAMQPTLTTDPVQHTIIANAIRWHDGDVLRDLLRSWGPITSDERSELMRQRVHPLLLKGIFADKLSDYGRKRLSHKLGGPEAPDRLENDPHAEANFLWESEEILLSEDNKELSIVMKWRPDMTEDEAEKFPYLWMPTQNHEGGRKARVTQRIHNVYREQRIDEFSISQTKFWEHALVRTTPAIEAAFALLPIDVLRVVFYDGERLDRVGTTPDELMENGINTGRFEDTKVAGFVSSANFIRGRVHDEVTMLIRKHMPKEDYQGVNSKTLFFTPKAA